MKFVKYDITFETEREVFVSYVAPPHVDYIVKFNQVVFIEEATVQELYFEQNERILIYMIKRGNFLNDILNSVLNNEKVIILRDSINLFECDSDTVISIKS